MSGPTGSSPYKHPLILATGATGAQSAFAAALAGLGTGTTYPNTNTNTTYLTQTSAPDIESTVNSLFQQLVGRYATPAEIKQYGKELLAAEKANPGKYTGSTVYDPASGKRAEVTGTQLSAGVDPSAFLREKVQKSTQAQTFAASTTAMGLLNQMARSGSGAA